MTNTFERGRVRWVDAAGGVPHTTEEGLFVDGAAVRKVQCFVAPGVRGFHLRGEDVRPDFYCRLIGGDALADSPLPAASVIEALTEAGFVAEVTEYTTREVELGEDLVEGSDPAHRIKLVRRVYAPVS